MVTWLVDGMNVIGSRPTGWWRDRPAAMRELVARLARFAARSGEHVTVVFDGGPLTDAAPAGVTVVFASRRGRDAADDDIAARAAPGTTVVTSDRDLARRAGEAGAEVMTAGAFLRRLDEAGA